MGVGPLIRFQAVSWTLGFMPKVWGYETIRNSGMEGCVVHSSLLFGLGFGVVQFLGFRV